MEWIGGVVILLVSLSLIPLAGYAATDSWRGAWQALRQYLLIMLAFVVLGGGLGLASAISEHGWSVVWSFITQRR